MRNFYLKSLLIQNTPTDKTGNHQIAVMWEKKGIMNSVQTN